MKRHNFNKRLHETRNIYPADFYEFDEILTKNGWVTTNFKDLEKHGKKYLGILIRNKRYKNHPKYVSFDELKEILEDYFDGNVRFSKARYKYAPEISENVIIVDSDIFDYADDQLEFDFDESLKESNRIYKFKVVLEQPKPERYRIKKDIKFKTREEAEEMVNAWNASMNQKAKDYGCKFVVEEIEDKPRKTSSKTSDDPDFSNPFKIGDILVGNVGYSMILPEFYEVIKTTPQYVTCVQLQTESVSGDYWQGTCIPVEGQYLRVRNHSGNTDRHTVKMQVKKYGKSGDPYKDYSAYLNRRYLFKKWNGRAAEYDHLD